MAGWSLTKGKGGTVSGEGASAQVWKLDFILNLLNNGVDSMSSVL